MSTDAQQKYLESQIFQADGIQLIQILYRLALDAVQQARHHLQRGEIAARSRQISKACEIVSELALAVDHQNGGALSRDLVELYDYLQHLLHQANGQQIEPPLIEAQALLQTLLEAWQACARQTVPEVIGEPPLPDSDRPTSYVPLSCTY